MGRLAVLLLWWLASALAPSAAQAAAGILVWRLDAGAGADDATITTVSGIVAAEVERHAHTTVFSQADVLTMIEGERQRQLCGASDSSCIAEIGAAMGAPEAIQGDVGHLGDYWILNLRRISVDEARVIARVTRSVKGQANALVEIVPDAVAALFDVRASELRGRAPQTTKHAARWRPKSCR